MSKQTHSTRPIEVEDLLRLKRFEQPDQAFWASFDEKLHQKTLRALVRPEPLRIRFARRLRAFAHPALAMPAAAAVAFGVFIASPTKEEHTQGTIALEQAQVSPLDIDALSTQFAANTLKSESNTQESFTKLRANQTLTTGLDNVQYAASTYTTDSYAYASTPAHSIY